MGLVPKSFEPPINKRRKIIGFTKFLNEMSAGNPIMQAKSADS